MRERTRRRLRAVTMREVHDLGAQLATVEETAAENRAVRPDLARLVAELEDRVAAFERGLSHAAPQVNDR